MSIIFSIIILSLIVIAFSPEDSFKKKEKRKVKDNMKVYKKEYTMRVVRDEEFGARVQNMN